MEFTEQDYQCLQRLMTWRRDVRHFLPDPVQSKYVDQLRLAMDLAPSVGNSRPWRVFQVDSAHKRQAVHRIFLQSNEAAAQAQESARRAQYLQLKLEGLQVAPIQLAVFTDTEPAAGHGLGRHSMPSTLESSTAMAVQNLNLMARVLGFGVGMVTILDAHAMGQLFEVPEHWRFSLYLCIGWPEHYDDTPLLHRNGWQANGVTDWQPC